MLPSARTVYGQTNIAVGTGNNTGNNFIALDISGFPTGAKIAIIASGYTNDDTSQGTNVRVYYNGTYSQQNWHDRPATGKAAHQSVCEVITKASGVNTAHINIATTSSATYNEIYFTALAIPA